MSRNTSRIELKALRARVKTLEAQHVELAKALATLTARLEPRLADWPDGTTKRLEAPGDQSPPRRDVQGAKP